jgi:hypothetical protein
LEIIPKLLDARRHGSKINCPKTLRKLMTLMPTIERVVTTTIMIAITTTTAIAIPAAKLTALGTVTMIMRVTLRTKIVMRKRVGKKRK